MDRFTKAGWCVIVLIWVVFAAKLYRLENDAATQKYIILVGSNAYYCNSFSYDDDGSLLLSDCIGNQGPVLIRYPSNIVVEAR